jgi:pectate lyase
MKFASLKITHARSRIMKFSQLLVGAALLVGATAAQALPVIRGAAGYGMETTAGRGGTVYRVTNVNASGAGSLKACVDATGPRVCVFEVSGTIRLTTDLMIRNDRLTIAGQTAPSPGIMIRGAAIRIQASHILIQHLRVRAGDDTNGPDPANRDSLKLEGSSTKPVTNIVIDHCSFSWSIDEIASVWGPHDNITFSNNIFAEPLHQSIHRTDDGSGYESHGFGVLLGSSASGGRITMVGNLFAHNVERNPLVRSREFVFVNNLVYNRVNVDLDVQSQDGRTTRSSIVGNVFLRGPSYARTTRPIYVRTSGSYSLLLGSRVYVHDNHAPETSSSTSGTTLVSLTGGDVLSGLLQLSTAPVWNTGLTARSTANSAVYNRVLTYAGARPSDRDTVDRRIVSNVKNRSGQVINCVSSNGSTRCQKNAGGWPSYAQNTRRLTLPSSPNSVASNGYTNLENWLYSMDQSIQGITQSTSPTSPPSLSVQ